MTGRSREASKRPAHETVARLLLRPGTAHQGWLAIGPWRLSCALGRSGVARRKREGDGATPAGRLRLVGLLGRRDRRIARLVARPVAAIRPDHAWCEAPDSPAYNRLVRLPHPAASDPMIRDDRLYDLVGVLDWNLGPRPIRGRGSAIFLHQSRPGYGPSAGCVTLEPRDLRRLLTGFGPRIAIAIGEAPRRRRDPLSRRPGLA